MTSELPHLPDPGEGYRWNLEWDDGYLHLYLEQKARNEFTNGEFWTSIHSTTIYGGWQNIYEEAKELLDNERNRLMAGIYAFENGKLVKL